MHHVMILGAGKIGSLIACLLTDANAYHVHLADVELMGTDLVRLTEVMPEIVTVALDVSDQAALENYIKKHQISAVISSLPYFLNMHVAKAAKQMQIHYFDLTEDTTITQLVKEIAQDAKSAFVPQCGLAPGFVNIVANSLMQEFEQCHQAKLRVGALPQRASNSLYYALTWSSDGLINEYGNPCYGIVEGVPMLLEPLDDLESIQIDGCEYEAFNTSGGLGSLTELYANKIQNLNYKTIRYPGHCQKMHFLMNDLKLNHDRTTLKRILENALPKTYQDIVLVYVAVEGIKQGEFTEKSYIKKIYPQRIRNLEWSAIQVSTASGVCAIVDLVLQQESQYQGLVLQEKFHISQILNNRFGKNFV